jgi:hypothetical protein
MTQGILFQDRTRTGFAILVALLLFIATTVPVPAEEPFVESYFWPPGFFLNFSKLKQAQKELMISEVEKKLAFLRQTGKGLMVRGDLMDKVRTDVCEFNPATILDQSGLVLMIRNFPNIYFNFNGPNSLLNRSTFLVVKNPKVDRGESLIRQSLVISSDFYAFSQTYFKSTVANLQKAYQAQSSQIQGNSEESAKGKKKRKTSDNPER